MTTQLRTIPTTDAAGEDNGQLILVWSKDSGIPVGQVYLTTIMPGKQKGPHLHLKRGGAFTVLVGRVLIVTREDGWYKEYVCGQGWKTIHVAPGIPCCLYNIGAEPAMVLSMPTEPYRDASDEHAVADWTYELLAVTA